MSLYQARSAYRQLSNEPTYYKEKVLAQVSGNQIAVDYSTLEAYQQEIDRLQNEINSWKRTLDSIANRSGKRYREDREEARELRSQFTQLGSTLTEVKTNIGRTIDAFQATDRQTTRAIGQIGRPTIKSATTLSPKLPSIRPTVLGGANPASSMAPSNSFSHTDSFSPPYLTAPSYTPLGTPPSLAGAGSSFSPPYHNHPKLHAPYCPPAYDHPTITANNSFPCGYGKSQTSCS